MCAYKTAIERGKTQFIHVTAEKAANFLLPQPAAVLQSSIDAHQTDECLGSREHEVANVHHHPDAARVQSQDNPATVGRTIRACPFGSAS